MPRWPFAPFLLGVTAAVVLEVGTGLLVYLSPGLLPALTVVLAVGMGALALGLLTPASPGEGRWRWLATTGALAVAAALSAGWTFAPGDSGAPSAPGLHLGVLVAAPLYGVGACLATLSPDVPVTSFAPAVLLGAAAGVVLLGLLLVPRLEPVSVYLFCVLCASAAALVRPRA